MSEVLVYALHGFLGSANDWQGVQNALPPEIRFRAESFFAPGFTQFHFQSEVVSKKIFLGYSLGGRLGLRILSQTPGEFDHYIFVSVHPGLADDDREGREARAVKDRSWSDRISADNWNCFLKDWNSQDVFKNTKKYPMRRLSDFDPALLIQSLTRDSLSQQADCRPLIQQHQERITWVVGSRDLKFKQIAENMRQVGILKKVTEVESGHRVLFDNPRALAQIIESILPTGF